MITIYTMPRSGSTFYSEYLAKKNKALNLEEFFAPSLAKDFSLITLSDKDHMDKLEYCRKFKNSIVKVFPWHISNLVTDAPQPSFLEHAVHKLTHEKHFLIRSDLNSQIKSFYLAENSSIWKGSPQEHEEVTVDEEIWDKIYHHYIQGYTVLADWYNKSPDATLIDYSELPFHTSTKERYVRPVTWATEPPQYDIDIREFFV